MSFFLGAVDAAIFAKLNTDATLLSLSPGGIHRTAAPKETAFPLTHVQYYASKPADYSLGALIRAQLIYTVKGISSEAGGQTDMDAYAIADRVFALLLDPVLVFAGTGWAQLKCRPQATGISIDEGVAGQNFYHRGDYISINVTPAP